MSGIELMECSRMNVRISERQCGINRKGLPGGPGKPALAPCLSCEGCPGLGVATVIEIEEVSMSVRQCSVHNCTSLVHARGMCWKHEKSELGINPKTGKPLAPKPVKAKTAVKAAKVAPHADDIDSCDACGTYPCSCFDEGQDATANYERLQEVVEAEKVAACAAVQPAEVVLCDMGIELDKLFRAKRFLDMADAIEGLGY